MNIWLNAAWRHIWATGVNRPSGLPRRTETLNTLCTKPHQDRLLPVLVCNYDKWSWFYWADLKSWTELWLMCSSGLNIREEHEKMPLGCRNVFTVCTNVRKGERICHPVLCLHPGRPPACCEWFCIQKTKKKLLYWNPWQMARS